MFHAQLRVEGFSNYFFVSSSMANDMRTLYYYGLGKESGDMADVLYRLHAKISESSFGPNLWQV